MKRILKFLVVAIMLFSATSIYAFGEIEFCYNGVYYSYSTYVDGTPHGYAYVIPNKQDSSYRGDIIIPEIITNEGNSFKVTEIRRDAFKDCTELKSIVIPNTVTEIGFDAFSGSSLESIIIGNSVNRINARAFKGCTELRSIEIPSSVRYIGDKAFANCKKLSSITFPNSAMYIGNCLFEDCDSLSSISIPQIITIAEGAFMGNTGLRSITVGNTKAYSGKPDPIFRLGDEYICVGKAVDLGLSVLWSDRNVGAATPETIGNYYAWGEKSAKLNYTYDNWAFNKGDECYDVAYLKWGKQWRYPTLKQWKELIEKTNRKDVVRNGQAGWLFTSKINGNSIFIPYANYWSSSIEIQKKNVIQHRILINIIQEGTFNLLSKNFPYYGFQVRPICIR